MKIDKIHHQIELNATYLTLASGLEDLQVNMKQQSSKLM